MPYKSVDDLPRRYQAQVKEKLEPAVAQTLRGRKGKYNAQPVEVDGIRFASKREASYYSELKMQQEAGEITGFLMQVPFRFRSGITYRADFLIVNADGSLRLVDTKGFLTPEFKLKQKLMSDEYGWLPLEVVK